MPRIAAVLWAGLGASVCEPARAAEPASKLFYGVEINAAYDLVERGKAISWETEFWVGTDERKLWIRSEGQHRKDDLDEAELHVYYRRMIAEFWDVHGGLRYDFAPIGTTFGAFGVRGMLPYRVEVDLTGFVSHRGRLSARLEFSREIQITRRVVADPYVRLDFAAQNEFPRQVAAGLSELETGVKLTYEITREVAPFVEFRYQRNIGYSAVLSRQSGDDPENIGLLVGIRLRF